MVVIFLARVFFIPKKLLHIVRNKKKESCQLVKKQKVIQSEKISNKCPKNSNFLVQEYAKVLQFLKNLKTFSLNLNQSKFTDYQ